jgi:hypothetical protein
MEYQLSHFCNNKGDSGMRTAVTTGRVTEAWPRLYARIAGALYLIVIVGGIFAEIFVRGRLVVHGDAAATAHNIQAHELLYRLGFVVKSCVRSSVCGRC